MEQLVDLETELKPTSHDNEGAPTTLNLDDIPDPIDDARSWCGYLAFGFLNPLLAKGLVRPIEPEDLPPLDTTQSCESVAPKFHEAWKRLYMPAPSRSNDVYEGEAVAPCMAWSSFFPCCCTAPAGPRPSVWSAVIQVEHARVYVIIALTMMTRGFDVGRALILRYLITALTRQDFEWTAIWSAVLAAATALMSWTDHHRRALGTTTGIDVRAGLMFLMHGKLLRLPPSSVSKGVLSTLTGTDSSKVVDVLMWASRGLGGPLVLVAAFVIAGQMLGWAVFAAVGMALVLVPINVCVAGGFEATQKKLMESQQARMKVLGEAL